MVLDLPLLTISSSIQKSTEELLCVRLKGVHQCYIEDIGRLYYKTFLTKPWEEHFEGSGCGTVDRSLPIPEDSGSNPVIGNFY